MEAAIFVSLWFGSSLRTGSLQVRARAKNYHVYDVKSFSVAGDSLAAIGQGMKRTWKIPWQEFNSLAGVVIRVQLLKNPQLVSLLSVGISSLVDFTKFDVCCLAAREPRQPKSPL